MADCQPAAVRPGLRRHRDKIVSLEIAPGAPIEEEQLAAELSVGRTPVRQAIKRLAHRRLVVIYPRSGSFAADLHPADLEALCDVRERLEGLAAERAATEATYEERQELRQVLDELDASTDPVDLLKLNVAVPCGAPHGPQPLPARHPHPEPRPVAADVEPRQRTPA
jgi:DNA-binding GntR family transcriptional regulator